MYTLGISAFYHDSAAVLLQDGVVIYALQEERFTRKKRDDSFPKNCINHILSKLDLDLSAIDAVVFTTNLSLNLTVYWKRISASCPPVLIYSEKLCRFGCAKTFFEKIIITELKRFGEIDPNRN